MRIWKFCQGCGLNLQNYRKFPRMIGTLMGRHKMMEFAVLAVLRVN